MSEDSVALYERYGRGYSQHRQPDPRIAAAIGAALDGSRTVVNVGAGGGSYEPSDRYVLAVEPSQAMRAERSPSKPPAIDAYAEALPLDDDSVDAALAVLSFHHWIEPERGLCEMRRVARGPVVILTFDPLVKRQYWLLSDYLPETAELDQQIFPPPEKVLGILSSGRVESLLIPADCQDGFLGAFYARPELYLDPGVRRAQSGWGRLPAGVEDRVVTTLSADLASGAWDARYGDMRRMASYDGGLRLVISPGEVRHKASQ